MMHKLNDVPLERLVAEHYLFDLGQSVKKTAEILDMDEEKVRRIYQESFRFYPEVRKDH